MDALDSRLANAEENLSRLPIDPFNDIKQVNVQSGALSLVEIFEYCTLIG